MIKLLVFGICICLLILIVTKQPVKLLSRFHGNWRGEITGDKFGTIILLAGDDGKATGTIILEDREYSFAGTINKAGELKIETEEMIFSGIVSESAGAGDWHTVNMNLAGNWRITRE